MVKDPWWLYAYWEILPSTERAARSRLEPQEISGLQSVLRVYDVTETNERPPGEPRWCDIALSGLATNWFIHTNAPNHSFVAEIGLLTNGGRFVCLARSNRVTAPRFGPSEIIDEFWASSDEAYWKLFGASAGAGQGSSPLAWSAMLSQSLFSGAWSSMGLAASGLASVRGFWCRVNTDLVVHGATEPKATVIIQGQQVPLRKDGSFSLRLSLPEGTQSLEVEVISPDGRQTKTVTPVVTLAWSGALASDDAQTRATLSRQRPSSGEAS